uniref:Uncharacterized protein n=1 Tax=Candidatus Kentrum sp. LPFa TaxID=2126335 RepID=A0A450X9L0_9GAMM|nr:MAG: hypothetical protein BECKLPF1236B_GA0070989_15451 [Candidatus Kentron sp. LPFa]
MPERGTSVNGGNRPPRGNGEGVAQASSLPNTRPTNPGCCFIVKSHVVSAFFFGVTPSYKSLAKWWAKIIGYGRRRGEGYRSLSLGPPSRRQQLSCSLNPERWVGSTPPDQQVIGQPVTD